MSGLYNEQTIAKIKTFKGILQKVAVWIFVAGVILGAAMILFGNASEMETFGRVLGTLFVLALAMLVSVNNFRRLEDNDKAVQIFATLGFIMNLIWMALWISVIWGVDMYTRECSSGPGIALYCEEVLSIVGKFAYISSYLSALGFLGSNIMAIREGKKKGVIRPLKITALVCVIYELVYSTVVTLSNLDLSEEASLRANMLAGFAGFVWVITTLIAMALSKRQQNNEKIAEEKAERAELIAKVQGAGETGVKNKAPVVNTKTEEELRAEIEEKVRREMIEKEVRERVEKEMAERGEKS